MSTLSAATILVKDKSISGDLRTLYPSPSPSPTVFPPTSPNDHVIDIHPVLKKRRKSLCPIKTVSKVNSRHDLKGTTKALGAAMKLDVYKLYLIDPNSLIGSRIVSKRFNSMISTQSYPGNAIQACSSVTSSGQVDAAYEEEVIQKPVNDRCKPLVAPVPTTDFDNSMYQNTQGAPHVLWKKGSCLNIPPTVPFYDQLTEEEIRTCSTLRVLPDQYLHIKQTILSAAEVRGPFKKRDAKSWFRIDVNKTAVLFDWFRSLGWIPSDEEWELRTKKGQSSCESSLCD